MHDWPLHLNCSNHSTAYSLVGLILQIIRWLREAGLIQRPEISSSIRRLEDWARAFERHPAGKLRLSALVKVSSSDSFFFLLLRMVETILNECTSHAVKSIDKGSPLEKRGLLLHELYILSAASMG